MQSKLLHTYNQFDRLDDMNHCDGFGPDILWMREGGGRYGEGRGELRRCNRPIVGGGRPRIRYDQARPPHPPPLPTNLWGRGGLKQAPPSSPKINDVAYTRCVRVTIRKALPPPPGIFCEIVRGWVVGTWIFREEEGARPTPPDGNYL